MTTAQPLEHFKPRARLRIGVTGHRTGPKLPPEVEPKVAETVGRLIAELKQTLEAAVAADAAAFAAEPPELVVVSNLAEGADRIVATQGLAHGAALEIVLPAPRADYETDFETKESKDAFRALLKAAKSVFELENSPGRLGEKRGYEAAGLIMLAHTDVLITVWNEEEAEGIGGTGAIVEHAVNEGAPVLLINPAAPDKVRLLWTGDVLMPPAMTRIEVLPHRDGFEALPKVVATLVAPPSDTEARDQLDAFFAEPPGRRHGWPIYSLFLGLLGVRSPRSSDFGPAAEDLAAGERWRGHFPRDHGEDGLTHAVGRQLLPLIERCDAQAVRYAELYRSAFVFNYLAAAVTVTLALIGLAPELPWMHAIIGDRGATLFKVVLVSAELFLIGCILWVWWRGADRQWHRRWLDYRRVAESLRHLRILTLVGARSASPRPRTSMEPLDKLEWVDWLVLANERMLPPPNRVVDDAYIAAVRGALTQTELDEQIAYNRKNAHRMEHAEERLHVIGYALFAIPALICLTFLLVYVVVDLGHHMDVTHQARFYVTQLSAICPSFGAALNAIRMQGDFDTVARRSTATEGRLIAIRDALNEPDLDFARLADLIQKSAEVLGADVAEWRTLFRTRPLSLPA
jgi:hypothetical protein